MSENTIQPLSRADVEELTQSSTQNITEDITEDSTVISIAVSKGELSTVLLHNDEVTPYDYVINILGDLFMLSEEMADHIAWTAHHKGMAVVVVCPRVEAEKLINVARGRARTNGYPLTFTLGQG